MKEKMTFHSETNDLRSRLFFVCFALSVLEVLILSPLGLGERFMLTVLCFFLIPLGFACSWFVLIVQFYNPVCTKVVLKYACLFFFYGCLLIGVLSCIAAPFIRFLTQEPMDVLGLSLATPANIGGCLGSLFVLGKVN